jgi:hypothetical protein
MPGRHVITDEEIAAVQSIAMAVQAGRVRARTTWVLDGM